MSPLLYIFRHGQTDWNAEQRLQGQKGIPLNDRGRAQARVNGQKLAELLDDPSPFEYISSPLGRSRETMEIVRQELGLPRDEYRIDNQLIEISFGDWESHTFDELRSDHSAEVDARLADKWNHVPPHGESYAMLHARIAKWFATITKDSVISCHGGVLRVLMHELLGTPSAEAVDMIIEQDKVFCWHGAKGEWK